MCGILLNIGREEITPDHPALDVIKHRGPDDFGAVSFDNPNFKIGLGHRRLSIIDLSTRGKQPMTLQDGNLWIVYNGEIYNYLELKEELTDKGHKFVSDSDTEVLLASYREWGKDCLKKLNGMFSICIFDKEKNLLFIARDRFGIKPLYYYNSSEIFRAGSEIKQFTSIEGFQPEANREKLYHFLNTGDFDYDEVTLWKNIFELLPGHYIELDLNSWKPGNPVMPQCWYSPPLFEKIDITFEDAVSEFRNLLNNSVKLRLRADVPVGFLLSGGLDSSTLVGMAHQIPREKGAHLKAYSSCYEDKNIDEREYIHEMLKFTGADSCLHYPKPEEIAENLDQVIWHNDIPILHGSPVPHSLIYRHIKNENDSRKVILEGQGADEILCGYGDFYWAFLYEQLTSSSIFSFLHQFRIFQQKHHEPWKIVLRKWRRLKFPDSVRYDANPALDTKFLLNSSTIPPRAVKREEPTVSELHRNRLTILRYILHNVDRNSMAQSRETRVPYLDHNLVEFCLKLPSSYKISEGLSKRVLRSAVKDLLPEKINKRVDKQGYSSPVPTWAKNELSTFFKENLTEACRLPFVKEKNLVEEFDKFTKGAIVFDPIWWRLIAVDHWVKIFNVNI